MGKSLKEREEENGQLILQIEEQSKRVDSLLADNAELIELHQSYEDQLRVKHAQIIALENRLVGKLDNVNDEEAQTDDYLWQQFLT